MLHAKQEGLTITTKSNAGGTRVVGNDAENLYIHADEENAEVIYSLGRTKDRTLTEVLRLTEGVMSHPQIDGSSLWYVIDGQRVFRLALEAGAARKTEKAPKEIFGIGYASCGLAAHRSHRVCSEERRPRPRPPCAEAERGGCRGVDRRVWTRDTQRGRRRCDVDRVARGGQGSLRGFTLNAARDRARKSRVA